MSFDFGQKRIVADSNQQRNSGMYTKTILGKSIGAKNTYLKINKKGRIKKDMPLSFSKNNVTIKNFDNMDLFQMQKYK